MPDPILFDSVTSRLALPMLFAGQAQKEAFVNEALARIDALLHCAAEGTRNDPPLAPQDGETWLIGSVPTGDWLGKAGQLACRQSGQWLYASPRDGMRVLDRSTGTEMRYADGWGTAATITPPTGGTTVDTQARAVLTSMISALAGAGIVIQG